MHAHSSRRFAALLLAGLPVAFSTLLLSTSAADRKKDKDDDSDEVVVLSPFCVEAGSLGATPGGAQDISFFRMGAGHGQIPHPNSLTPEGLFSEHDLPLELGTGGDTLFRVQAAAIPARFEVLPDVRYLAQLGFSSSLRADTWHRAPLNLVAVIDKSGSMSGPPLALVRASLHSALAHLRNGDQISIVLYGDRSYVHLAPTVVEEATRATIAEQINRIESAGSTAMEEGLKVGYRVAHESAAGFKGTTRVMLFTDERPNVGNTAAEGFMAMAEAASRDGVGLTTIGVGVQFGADLATRISSVRGGNLFFFEDGEQMKKTFAEDFDTMVTELAYEFAVRINPTPGYRVAGVFGVPADLLRWDGDALVLDVATIFLSKRKGAIYFALSPEAPTRNLPARAIAAGDPLARIDFQYRDARDGAPVSAASPCRLLAPDAVQAGLSRGACLVDQYLTLKKAAQVHLFENDQETAYRLVHGLLTRLQTNSDADLAPELKLVRDLHNTLAFLSGHTGEIEPETAGLPASPLIGVWHRTNGPARATAQEYLIIWPNGVVDPVQVDRHRRTTQRQNAMTVAGALPVAPRGQLSWAPDSGGDAGPFRFEIDGDRLTLHVADWPDGSTTLVLKRGRIEDVPMGDQPDDEASVEPLSGLPTAKVVSTDPTTHRTRRIGTR